MEHFKEIQVTKQKLEFTSCDDCGVEVKELDLSNEIVSISNVFGFGSNRDGTEISFDLCEKCFMKMIKDIKYREKERY